MGEVKLQGSFVAIVTPFKGGKLDMDAFGELIDWQIAEGTHGIVPCGTTGESATLTHDEHKQVVEYAVKRVNGRVPVVAGTGSNSTDETIMLTRHAKDVGADAALIITPYYNKPSQEGLYRHFKAISDDVDIPIVMYNVPGRTAVNMSPETVARCAGLKNVIAIKEATADMNQAIHIRELCGDKLTLMSGDDFTVLPFLAVGGSGVISVVANIAPADMAGLCNAYFAGDLDKARNLQYKLQPLVRMMFIDTNPVPVKAAVGMLGRCSGELRLPLCPMPEASEEKLKVAMKDYGLI
jgi:4-hydroxy-tetrahydrodipicolinate synthase